MGGSGRNTVVISSYDIATDVSDCVRTARMLELVRLHT